MMVCRWAKWITASNPPVGDAAGGATKGGLARYRGNSWRWGLALVFNSWAVVNAEQKLAEKIFAFGVRSAMVGKVILSGY